LSEALIAGKIFERPSFLEVYLESNQLYYRPIGSSDETATEEKAAGVLLYSN
jgi:ATP-dependent Clp protease ATP-binding subunit ClpC